MNRQTPKYVPFPDMKNRISDQLYFCIYLKISETDLYSHFSGKKILIICKSYLYSCKKCSNSCKSYLYSCKKCINSCKSYLYSCKKCFNSCKSYLYSYKKCCNSCKKYLRVDLKKRHAENNGIETYPNPVVLNLNNGLFTSYLIFYRSQLSDISTLIT